MNETEDITYESGAWVALTRVHKDPCIIPYRVGKEPMVPFGAVGRIVFAKPPEQGRKETHYHVAFHAGWTALNVPHEILRPARMLEQLALCADGC